MFQKRSKKILCLLLAVVMLSGIATMGAMATEEYVAEEYIPLTDEYVPATEEADEQESAIAEEEIDIDELAIDEEAIYTDDAYELALAEAALLAEIEAAASVAALSGDAIRVNVVTRYELWRTAGGSAEQITVVFGSEANFLANVTTTGAPITSVNQFVDARAAGRQVVVNVMTNMETGPAIYIHSGTDVVIMSDVPGGVVLGKLAGNTAYHFTVNGSLTLEEGITLQGHRPSGFAWPAWHYSQLTPDCAYGSRDFIVSTASGWAYGGGVALNNAEAIFTMNAGSVIRDSRQMWSGAVRIHRGTFVMNNGAVIEGNFATTRGGGVAVSEHDSAAHHGQHSTFVMNEGAIIRNNVAGVTGGAIYAIATSDQAASAIHINGGLIQGNAAGASAGGIGLDANSNLFLNDVQIIGNTAGSGAGGLGVFSLAPGVSVVINGGTIRDNVLKTLENESGSGVVIGWGAGPIVGYDYRNLQIEGDNTLVFVIPTELPGVPGGSRIGTTVWPDGVRIVTYPRGGAMLRDGDSISVSAPDDIDTRVTLPDGTEVDVPGGGRVVVQAPPSLAYRVYDEDGNLILERNADGSYAPPTEEPGTPWGLPWRAALVARNTTINLWGETNLAGMSGLLRANDVTGVAVPQILFDLVAEEQPVWEAWFMAHRVWDPTATAQVFPLSAALSLSASNLTWNDANRITDLEHFFSYLELIILRAVDQHAETGIIGYLSTLEAGITDVVVGLEVDGFNWNQVTNDLGGPFGRVVRYVLSPSITITVEGSGAFTVDGFDGYTWAVADGNLVLTFGNATSAFLEVNLPSNEWSYAQNRTVLDLIVTITPPDRYQFTEPGDCGNDPCDCSPGFGLIVEPGTPWELPWRAALVARNTAINLWGETNLAGMPGLLRANDVTGVAIPQVLFELVAEEQPEWEAWFMAHRVWDPTATAQAFPFSAALSLSASNLPWNDASRIADLEHFFTYLERIIVRAVTEFERTGTIGYLSGLEAGITDVVVGLAVDGFNWNQVADDLGGPFGRVVRAVLQGEDLPQSDIVIDVADTGTFTVTSEDAVAYTWVIVEGNLVITLVGAHEAIYRVDLPNANWSSSSVVDGTNRVVTIVPEAGFTFDPPFVWGDLNGDGVVGMADVLMLQQYIAGMLTADEIPNFAAAAVSGNATVGMADLMLLRQYIAGAITSFPVSGA
ncbi:MAG: dockerin type I domain-containing protein [Oscillospiraceae bacterium]|nr:dockerin type I domain-containing protein [Oscillospiraceae bacterium]